MNEKSQRFYSRFGRHFGAIVIAAAMMAGEVGTGLLSVSASDTGAGWKTEVETAIKDLQQAEHAVADYAVAEEALKSAYNAMEGARHVTGLTVAEVGTDYITLQWNAYQMTAEETEGGDRLIGYNVYWADTDEPTTIFQLLDKESNNLYDEGQCTIPIADVQESGGSVTFKVKMSTFHNLYFKVAIVTEKMGVETQTQAVMSPTAVSYETQLEALGRGMTATAVSNGVFLNWRLLTDDLDGGYTKTGLTGTNFNVYRKNNAGTGYTKIATVKNSTNYLDEGRTILKDDTYKIVPVNADGSENEEGTITDYTIFKEEIMFNAGKNVAYLEIPLQQPDKTTIGETYGLTDAELSLGTNLGNIPQAEVGYTSASAEITYSAKDTTVVDVDNDGEYEYLVEWDPTYGTDVSTQGYTGKQYIDCYELDGTLRWRLDLGVNIRSGSHYTEMGAFDYEGDGKAELIVKTAPGSKMTRYKLDENGRNVKENGKLAVEEENYITIPADDAAAGVTDESNYVCSASDYRDYLIDMFQDWGVWSRYSNRQTVADAIDGHWGTNLIDLFSVSHEWSESNFYTGIQTSAGNVAVSLTGDKNKDLASLEAVIAENNIVETEAEKLRHYITKYYDGVTLVNVCVRDADGNLQYSYVQSGVSYSPLMKTVFVDEVADYAVDKDGTKLDISGVALKSASVENPYTEEEATLLADYFLQHYQYRMWKHNLNVWEGYIITGPEYITLFDCETGEELDTQDWYYGREDDGMLWGDYAMTNIEPGNRCDRFNVAVAYLDGETPSCIMGRGYYTRTTMVAYHVVREAGKRKLAVAGSIDSGWTVMDNPFNAGPHGMDGTGEFAKLAGQGDHYIAVADINLDGRQDIINGGAIVSYDMETKKLYLYDSGEDYLDGGNDDPETTRGLAKYGHGDAIHITDINPDRPGLEIASCFEGGLAAPYNWALRDARTNTVIFGDPGTEDFARLMIGDVMPDVRGIEITTGYAANGKQVALPNRSTGTNMNIRWAADMTTQFFGGSGNNDNVVVFGSKNGERYDFISLKGCGVNGTKGTPDLMADLFGDSRDEILIRTLDSSALRIYMSTEVSGHKNYTLMQNPQYRVGVAAQNSSYSQPPYTDYYYASDTNWKYVTIPNKPMDQAPGAVTQIPSDDHEKETEDDWKLPADEDESEIPEPEPADPDEATGTLLWSEDFEGGEHNFKLLDENNSSREHWEADKAAANSNKSGHIYGVATAAGNNDSRISAQAIELTAGEGENITVSLDLRMDAPSGAGLESYFSLLGETVNAELTGKKDALADVSQILTITASNDTGDGNNTGGWWQTFAVNGGQEDSDGNAIVKKASTQKLNYGDNQGWNTSNPEHSTYGGTRDTTGWLRLIASIDFSAKKVDVKLKRISDQSVIYDGQVDFVTDSATALKSIFISAAQGAMGSVFVDNVSIHCNDADAESISVESKSLYSDETADAGAHEKEFDADKWAKVDTALAAMLIKTGMFEDESTSEDWDAALINRLQQVEEALDGVEGMPLIDTSAGDEMYLLASAKADDTAYSKSSRSLLKAAMEKYIEVKEAIDVEAEVQAVRDVIGACLREVDTASVTEVYSKYFDCTYTVAAEETAMGWIGVNAASEDSLYTAEKGYGLLKTANGRVRTLDDLMLKDFMMGADNEPLVFYADLPAGEIHVTFFTGDEDAGSNFSAVIYKGYMGASEVGTMLASTKPVSLKAAEYATVNATFTLEEAARVAITTANRINGMTIEQSLPLVVKTFSHAELQELIAEAAGALEKEAEYTVSSWKAYKTAYDKAAAIEETESETVITGAYKALRDAYDSLKKRSVAYEVALDFGPEAEDETTPAQVNDKVLIKEFLPADVTMAHEAPELGLGTMLYADHVDDNGLQHYGFTSVVDSGFTSGGGAYFRDWVYGAGGKAYTFKADVPAGQYMVYVYTGSKEGANTTKFYFGDGLQADESTNDAVAIVDGKTVYTQTSSGNQFGSSGECVYTVTVGASEDVISDVSALNADIELGVFSITLFNDEWDGAQDGITARLIGLEFVYLGERKGDDTPDDGNSETESSESGSENESSELGSENESSESGSEIESSENNSEKSSETNNEKPGGANSEMPVSETPKKGDPIDAGDNNSYTLTGEGTVQFTGTKAVQVKIPDTITDANGRKYKVTSIASGAFAKNKTKITSLTIGKNISAITPNQFTGFKKLKSVTIGTGVKSIGKNAFKGDAKLEQVVFKGTSKVTSIGASAFQKCTSLKKLTIPNSVKTIGASAFAGCTKLNTVKIGTTSKSALTTIGKQAFSDDKNLKSVTITSNKMKKVGANAFKGIKKNAKFTVPKKQKTKYAPLLRKAGVTKKMSITGKKMK